MLRVLSALTTIEATFDLVLSKSFLKLLLEMYKSRDRRERMAARRMYKEILRLEANAKMFILGVAELRERIADLTMGGFIDPAEDDDDEFEPDPDIDPDDPDPDPDDPDDPDDPGL